MDMNVALLPYAIQIAAVNGIRQAPAQPGSAGQGATALGTCHHRTS